MKRFICPLFFLLLTLSLMGQERTLRLDYSFSGTSGSASVALDELRCIDGWAGRRNNLQEFPLKGNGQLTMRSCADGSILYRLSFSTLFQEWQNTEEAGHVRRSFENVFLVPMPAGKAEVCVELFDPHGCTEASLTHVVDPGDILIRPASSNPEVQDLMISGPADKCIDVVIVAEGYTESEMGTFWKDARKAMQSILSHEPFKTYRKRFNFRAVGLRSAESGVSIPAKGVWKDTPLHSHFSTFYSDRYLTTLNIKDLHDHLAGVPYEHIIILANTDNYGGGGIYNSYTLTTAHHRLFKPVVVHEFGHSFAGLADEYYYDDQYSNYYFPDCEPWEPNITTMYDFASKWEDMLGVDGVSVLEGGGYMSKGVWRPCPDCRMKTNEAAGFCPVCRRAIERMIRFYTD
ncbi:MAG: peptidase M64 [Bacteroidales bacterium]|nr:peptidase M64 [Bacteroidales bacterium]